MGDVRAGLQASLEALATQEIDIRHLDSPNRKTPFKMMLQEVDKLHKGEYFDQTYGFQLLTGGFLRCKFQRDLKDFGEGSRFDSDRK